MNPARNLDPLVTQVTKAAIPPRKKAPATIRRCDDGRDAVHDAQKSKPHGSTRTVRFFRRQVDATLMRLPLHFDLRDAIAYGVLV